jgi:hypothetical protein
MAAWRSGDWNGEPIYWHSGQTRSFRGTMVIMPKRDLGFAILTNSAGYLVQDPIDELSKALIAHFRGEEAQSPEFAWERYARMALLPLLFVQFLRAAMAARRLLKGSSTLPMTRSARMKAVAYVAVASAAPFALPALFGLNWLDLFGFAPDLAIIVLVGPWLSALRSLSLAKT